MTKNIFLSIVLLLFTAYSFADGVPAKKINNSTTSIKAFSPSDDNFLLPDGYFNINYNLGFSVGDMKDYIKENSYRGFMVDGRKFINDKVTIGGYMGWTGFFEKFDRKSYQYNDATTVTGVGANTYYNFTIGMNAHYYPLQNGAIKPYVGINVGPTYQNLKTQIGRFALEDNTGNLW